MTEPHYELVVTAPAARAIRETLSESVAFAVIAFIAGPLLDSSRRVGAALLDELEGIWSARRGTYRILYRVDEKRSEVIVLRVGHRRDIVPFSRTRRSACYDPRLVDRRCPELRADAVRFT